MMELRLLFKKYEELAMHLIVGVMTTIVSLIIYYGCVFTILNSQSSWQLQLANVLPCIGAVTFAGIMSKKLVFKSEQRDWLKETST